MKISPYSKEAMGLCVPRSLEAEPRGWVVVAFSFVGEPLGPDLLHRSQEMADTLQHPVLAVERDALRSNSRTVFNLGLPTRLEPSEYVRHVHHEATKIQQFLATHDLSGVNIGLFGASAGGLRALEIARTELIDPKTITLFDPPGIVPNNSLELGIKWAKHQVSRELYRPPRHKNPTPPPKVQGVTNRLISDVSQNLHFWRNSTAAMLLVNLASGLVTPNASTDYIVPEFTFSQSIEHAKAFCELLGELSLISGVDFEATVMPEHFHSHTDHGPNRAALTAATIQRAEIRFKKALEASLTT